MLGSTRPGGPEAGSPKKHEIYVAAFGKKNLFYALIWGNQGKIGGGHGLPWVRHPLLWGILYLPLVLVCHLPHCMFLGFHWHKSHPGSPMRQAPPENPGLGVQKGYGQTTHRWVVAHKWLSDWGSPMISYGQSSVGGTAGSYWAESHVGVVNH